MSDFITKAGWDALLCGIPMAAVLLFSFLRIDELIATPKRRSRHVHWTAGTDVSGRLIPSDPDGRPWDHRRSAEQFAGPDPRGFRP